MGYELEFKFSIEAGQLPDFLQYLGRPKKEITIQNWYYDTLDGQLAKQGYALRIRQVENQFLETLKRADQVDGGLHKRLEWEYPIKSHQLEIDLFPKECQELLHPIQHKLDALFTTNFHRKIWLLANDTIELALDQGNIKTLHASQPICEIELELKSDAKQLPLLETTAKKLATQFALKPETKSKAERGYMLFNQQAKK